MFNPDQMPTEQRLWREYVQLLRRLQDHRTGLQAVAKTGIDWWFSEVSKYNVNNPAPAYHYT